jgi:cytochrome c peroxidase
MRRAGLVAALVASAACAAVRNDAEGNGATAPPVLDASTDAPSADAGVDAAPDPEDPPGPPFAWSLPPGFPVPLVPASNPMSVAKVRLGRFLFYDRRLSQNGIQSCASCHEQAKAFADGATTSQGSTGERHPRNGMSLANVAYATTLTWANPLLVDLEAQALVPLFGERPVELGRNGKEAELLAALRDDATYRELFAAAYPTQSDPFVLRNVTKALACFQRTLISGRSPYDRYVAGDAAAISESAKRGLALFGSEKLECFHCHTGFDFKDAVVHAGQTRREARFHNTGLYDLDGKGAYPEPNTGVHAVTGKADDMGRFRVVTLRNIAVTAPYMHDGSIATLSDVLDHYAAGGRASTNPLKSGLLGGFTLSAEERADLLAFFASLTDEAFLTDPSLADPRAPQP